MTTGLVGSEMCIRDSPHPFLLSFSTCLCLELSVRLSLSVCLVLWSLPICLIASLCPSLSYFHLCCHRLHFVSVCVSVRLQFLLLPFLHFPLCLSRPGSLSPSSSLYVSLSVSSSFSFLFSTFLCVCLDQPLYLPLRLSPLSPSPYLGQRSQQRSVNRTNRQRGSFSVKSPS